MRVSDASTLQASQPASVPNIDENPSDGKQTDHIDGLHREMVKILALSDQIPQVAWEMVEKRRSDEENSSFTCQNHGESRHLVSWLANSMDYQG